MRPTTELVANNRKIIFLNPHFWGIIVIILGLSVMYYSHIFFINILDPGWDWLWRLVSFEINNKLNGILFCIPFIYAAIAFWWRGILITWLFSIAIMAPRIWYLSSSASSFVTNITFLLLPLLVVLIVTILRKWRETERKEMVEREEERQAYIAQIMTAQEDERKRISREIHDDTTQRLWIVANQVQALARGKLLEVAPKTAAELGTMRDTILHISEDSKRLSLGLRPAILDDLGLVPALRWLVVQMDSEGVVKAEISVEGTERQLPLETCTHLFRIVQEGLANVRHHSEATEVNVRLEYLQETVRLSIKDNGKGFLLPDINTFARRGKLGLMSMQERARLINGALKIDSKLWKGTSISLECPG